MDNTNDIFNTRNSVMIIDIINNGSSTKAPTDIINNGEGSNDSIYRERSDTAPGVFRPWYYFLNGPLPA